MLMHIWSELTYLRLTSFSPSLLADFDGLDSKTIYFTLKQMRIATNYFDAANKIGEGGFGPVYRV